MKKSFLTSFSFLFSLSLIVLSGCDSSSESFEKNTNHVTIDMGGDIIYNQPTALVADENNPLNHYSRIDTIMVYGYGFEYFHPDSLKNCNLKLIVSGKMRETETITSNIAFSVENIKDSLIFWAMFEAKNYVKEPNKWVNFKDSLIIPASANPVNAKKIKVFSSKGLGKGYFDLDDIKIEVKQE